MKLNTKFLFLISSFSLIMLIMTTVILSTFSMLRELQKFENQTSQMQKSLVELHAFPSTAVSSGVDVTTLVPAWEEMCANVTKSLTAITESSAVAYLSETELNYVDSLSKLWSLIDSELYTVESSLKDFADMPLSDFEKRSINANGAIVVITYLPESDDRKNLMLYSIQRLNQVAMSLQTTNSSFTDVLTKLNNSLSERTDSLFKFFAILNIVGTIFSAIVIFFISTLVTRRITKRVQKLQRVSNKLAQKDFSSVIDSNSYGSDEIRDLADSIAVTVGDLSKFLEIVKKSSFENVEFGQAISGAAADTASATNQISSNIDSLRRQFNDIEDAVKRSVSSLNRMSLSVTGLIKDNQNQSIAIRESDAASAKMAAFVEKIRLMAEENCEGAEDMQEAVSFGDQKIEASNAMLREVSNQLSEIAEIVDIINAVAEQTNILSMNAAIESAHAGESGKGFAVVAEEIRGLAESTGENARQISDALFSITSRMREAAEYSDHAAQAFSDVTGKSVSIHQSLNEILDNINEAADAASQVAAFSQRIAIASEKMNSEYDELNEQRGIVSKEMVQLEDVFTQSRIGLDEIKIGSDDIVKRMVEVSRMSNESRSKMTELSENLNQFRTAADSSENVETVEENDYSAASLEDDSEYDSSPSNVVAQDDNADTEIDIVEADDIDFTSVEEIAMADTVDTAGATDKDEDIPDMSGIIDQLVDNEPKKENNESGIIDDFDKFFS